MTTGLVVNGNATSGTYYYRREWSGVDGLFSTINGVRIRNINAYSMVLIQETRKLGNGGCVPLVNTNAPAFLFSSNDRLNLLSKVAGAVKEHQFNLAVSAAEFPQTVKLVVDTIHKLGTSVKHLRRGHFNRAAAALGVLPVKARKTRSTVKLSYEDTISSKWLELQYGWKPLLNDVYEGMRAIESYRKLSPRQIRVSASIKRWGSVPNGSTQPSYIKAPVRVRNSWRAVAYIKESSLVSRELGLLDPASVVWEKIPFSFVADWFIPIGNYLEVLNSIPNLEADFCLTQLLKADSEAAFSPAPGFEQFSTAICLRGCAGTYKRVTVTREKYVPSAANIPFPKFRALPQALSPGHMWNALALLASAVKF